MTPEWDSQQVISFLAFGIPLFVAGYIGGLGPGAALALGGFGGLACSVVYLTIRMRRGTYVPAGRVRPGQHRPELLPPNARRWAGVVALVTTAIGVAIGAVLGDVERGAALGIILAPAIAQATVYGQTPAGKGQQPRPQRKTGRNASS